MEPTAITVLMNACRYLRRVSELGWVYTFDSLSTSFNLVVMLVEIKRQTVSFLDIFSKRGTQCIKTHSIAKYESNILFRFVVV